MEFQLESKNSFPWDVKKKKKKLPPFAHILCGILRLLRVNVVFLTHAFYFEFNLQLPRLYNVYKQMGIVKSFQNIIDNVFIPLFEVTIDPSSHPQLHVFLLMVSIVCLLFCTYRLNNECLIVSFRTEMIRVLCHCQFYSGVVFTCVNFLWFLLLLYFYLLRGHAFVWQCQYCVCLLHACLSTVVLSKCQIVCVTI